MTEGQDSSSDNYDPSFLYGDLEIEREGIEYQAEERNNDDSTFEFPPFKQISDSLEYTKSCN